MKNVRIWGLPPYRVAVVHGGPGAPGSVAPVARELAKTMGVLEPLQTKSTVHGQIEELAGVIQQQAGLPVVLIGHSWGAWLAYLTAAQYPGLVQKLILVASGPFRQGDAVNIFPERLKRLPEAERVEVLKLIDVINGAVDQDKNRALARFGELLTGADAFCSLPLTAETEPLPANEKINRKVWKQAEKLRISGELLDIGKKIWCPVVAIHGDYDPHPAAGVQEPLRKTLKDFRFVLLEKCGHEPWAERYARDEFLRILRAEISV